MGLEAETGTYKYCLMFSKVSLKICIYLAGLNLRRVVENWDEGLLHSEEARGASSQDEQRELEGDEGTDHRDAVHHPAALPHLPQRVILMTI